MTTQYTPSLIASLGELHTIEYKGKGCFTLGYTHLNDLGHRVSTENEEDLWCTVFDDEEGSGFYLLNVQPEFPLDPTEKDTEIAMFKRMIADYMAVGTNVVQVPHYQVLIIVYMKLSISLRVRYSTPVRRFKTQSKRHKQR